jgi:hypothetical protein
VQSADLSGSKSRVAPEQQGARHRHVARVLLAHLFQQLVNDSNDPTSEFSRHIDFEVTRSFVYLDISDFSKLTPPVQQLAVAGLVGLVGDRQPRIATGLGGYRESLETSLCIGDGFIYVLRGEVDAVFFAAFLARRIQEKVARRRVTPFPDLHFRCAVDTGPVRRFYDPGRGTANFVGQGINDGSRVLGAIGKERDDIVFVSGRVYEKLMGREQYIDGVQEILVNLVNEGRKPDKHKNLHRVYSLNHLGLLATVPAVPD